MHDFIAGLVYPSTKSPAVGGLATYDGKRCAPQLYSGKEPAARSGVRSDLPLPIRRLAIWDHVEAKAAAWLRHPSSPKHVVLHIDRPPCPPPEGCTVHLQHLIPKNKSITIIVAPKNGPVEPWGRVHGTGRYLNE